MPLSRFEADLVSSGSWEGELVHVGRDGAQVVVASRWIVDRDERGEPRSTLEINNDITERKRAEEALRRASAYNRRLLEASLDPLVTIGTDGKITDVNEATEAATGYPRAELIGKDFADYFTEPEEAREGYGRVFREGWSALSPGDPAPGRAASRRRVQRFGVSGRGRPGHRRLRAARDITAQKAARGKPCARCRTSSTWPTTPSSSRQGRYHDPGTAR